jgi:hypothetical protein
MNREIYRISKVVAAGLVLSAVLILSSCEKVQITAPSVDPNTVWTLSGDIQPIFTSNCISCHGGIKPADLRAGKSYNSLTKGGFVTLPASESVLYKMVTSSEYSHSSRTTDTEKLEILYWIQQGALNN